MDGTFKSVWAAADDHCIRAMQSETKLSSDKNVNWSTFTGSWEESNNSDSIKAAHDKHFYSNSMFAFNAKKIHPVPCQSQDSMTPSAAKTDSNSMFAFNAKKIHPSVSCQSQDSLALSTVKTDSNLPTSEGYEAIPEEFRPNESARNLLPVITKPAGENVKMFNFTKNESNCTLKNESCHRKKFNENLKSTDFRNSTPKGIQWNDNLIPDSSNIEQQFSKKMQNSNFESVDIKEQKKGAYSLHNSIPNNYFSNAYDVNSKFSGKRNHKQNPPRMNPEISRVNDTRKHQNPSVRVLSKVTKLRVVTPGKQVETKKTTETWTTNSNVGATRNEREIKTQKEDKRQDDVLFENISSKSIEKKMVWMDDLCTTVKEVEEDHITFEYIAKAKSNNFQPHDRKETPQQNKSCSFTGNLRKNNNKKDFTGKYKSSNNSFQDRANEFIRAQYRYKPERESRKFERISIPNRQSKDEETVIKHEVKIIHVHQPDRRKGNRGFRGNKRDNNCPKPASHEQQLPENISSKMNSQSVDSNENDYPYHLEKTNETIYQYPSHEFRYVNRLFENKLKLNAAEEGTFSLFAKSEDRCIQTASFNNLKESEDVTNQRSLLIHYGAEISNAIVGSYSAMSIFLSFYKEWKNLRIKALHLLEDIIKNLTNTNNRRNKTTDVIEMFGNGGRLVAAIPDVRAALAGRIIAVVSDFFAKLFSSSPTLKDSGMNEFELMLCLQQDIDATSDMNLYGIQCDQNFQETCKLIEEFHKCIQGWCFKDITEGIEIDFLEDISTLNPEHHLVYYRRLQKWIERLAESSTSDISKAFSRGFQDFPDALGTINLLYWRYHAQGFDTVASFRSWNDIHELLQNGDSVAVIDVIKKIQNSILVLIKERSAMEKDVMELLQNEKEL